MSIFDRQDKQTLSDLWRVLKFVLCWPFMLIGGTKRGTRNKRKKAWRTGAERKR